MLPPNIEPNAERRFAGESMSANQVLRIIGNTNRPIIVDFDETLFLRNSTEEFLRLAQPTSLAEIILRCLDRLRPWRWLGGEACRDSWRVLFIGLLLPWSFSQWRRACRTEMATHVNVTLRQAMVNAGVPIIIASNGYNRIIRPILPHLGIPDVQLIACDLRRPMHRRNGKFALVSRHLSSDVVTQSIVITDSLTDHELLTRCAVPCLVQWDDAEFHPAVRNLFYIPGDYLDKVKQPHSAARRRLIKESMVMWLLAGLSAPAVEITQIFGLFFLFWSMWCVYEIGYYDNDCCAKRFEKDPALTTQAQNFQDVFFEKKAWLVAIVMGAFGILLIGGLDAPLLFILWASTLFGLKLTYWLYNRIDKDTRIWLYLVLQGFRFAAFVTVLQIGPVGWAICLSMMIAAWMDYVTYRYGRHFDIVGYPATPTRAYRLALLCTLLAAIATTGGLAAIWSLATPTALLWFAFLAYRYDWRKLHQRAHRLDR